MSEGTESQASQHCAAARIVSVCPARSLFSLHREPGDAVAMRGRRTEQAMVLHNASRLALEEASSHGVRCGQHAEDRCLPHQARTVRWPSTNREVPT